MNEKKTTLPSHRNQDWKKVKVETVKVNKLLPNIPVYNISKSNKLIYTRTRLVYDMTGVPSRNSNRNTKPGWEIRLEALVKRLQQKVKMLRK